MNFNKICDLHPFQENINCKFIILRKGIMYYNIENPNKTKNGVIIYNFLVADNTGSINVYFLLNS